MFVSALLAAACAPVALKPIAKVEFEPIDEMSGIVASRTYPGVYWVHNDSGDSSRIFAINRLGEVLSNNEGNRKEDAGKPAKPDKKYEGIEIKGAANDDWEDIAIDGDTLYISDCGNNGNARRDLGVYKVQEPNPFAVNKAKAIEFIPIRYPDQDKFPPSKMHFDCEAIFVRRGKLHFITKWRVNRVLPEDGAGLYVLDRVRRDGQVNTLRKIGTRTGLSGWVTAADLSPNGKVLAVLVQAPGQAVWFFDATKDDVFAHPIKNVPFTNAQQCEAICWTDNSKLLITNEQREIFEISY